MTPFIPLFEAPGAAKGAPVLEIHGLCGKGFRKRVIVPTSMVMPFFESDRAKGATSTAPGKLKGRKPMTCESKL